MEPKLLLVSLFWCILLFNPAQAICVPLNQSDPHSSPSHSSSSSTTTTTSSSSKSPPSSAEVAHTPPHEKPHSSHPEPSSIKLPKNSHPKISMNVGVNVRTVTDPNIKSLCDKTDQPSLCMSSISPFYNGKSDVGSVVWMLMRAGTEQTKRAIRIATKMANDAKNDPKKVSSLNDCKEVYDDALDNLQKSMDAITPKDVGTINTMMSAAISDYASCDDGFSGQPDPNAKGVSPMGKINENLMNIAAIILSLANMIH
ncbi:hypothetical protein DITRI_Ditri15bG0134000 [Diplodiscus trichospermus]